MFDKMATPDMVVLPFTNHDMLAAFVWPHVNRQGGVDSVALYVHHINDN